MNRKILPVLAALFLTAVSGVQAQTFGIKAVLGTFTTEDSTDSWREGLNYFLINARQSKGSSDGWNASLEFSFYFSENFYLSVGTGYLNKEVLGGKAVFSYPETSGYHGGFSLQPICSLTLLPVTVSLGHHFWLGDSLRLVVFGGAGYYFGDITTVSDTIEKEPEASDNIPFGYWPTYYKADLKGPGLHAGVSLDIVLSENTFFLVETLYRRLMFEDLESEMTQFATDFDPGEGEGAVLLHYKLLSGEGPGGVVYRMSRLNVSGFQVQGGVRFRF